MYNFKKVIAFTAAAAVLGVSSLTVPFSVFADEAETEISTVSETETTAAEAVNDAKNETKPETQTENSEETETPNVPMHESAE